MNTFKSIGTHALTSALLATALGFCSNATLAQTDSFFQTRANDLIDRHITYSSKRWPVHQNVHKHRTSKTTEFSSLEEKPVRSTDMQTEKRITRGCHRRSPCRK
jgi:hypothetical protein